MRVRPLIPATCCALMLLAAAAAQAPAQEPKAIAYPERDILSPFRNPSDVYAPPDEIFRLLRAMQNASAQRGAKRSFDSDGREVVDDPAWREAKTQLDGLRLDAGYLAQVMRLHRNGTDRATAFYGAFFCKNVDHVLNLISHIPGEPVRATREAAMPRAIEYLRRHLGQRFGQLSDEQKQTMINALPQVGSPAAKATGVNRLPADEDHLHTVLLTPFFQLLDLDDPLDQAQGLWFLKEVFTIRLDLASLWLEPALPRIKQLLRGESQPTRQQAIELLQVVGPKKLRPPPTDDVADLMAWADEAAKELFPPIRHINDAIVQIFPSPERDAIAAAAIKSLENSSIGSSSSGQRKDGTYFRGFKVELVPDELRPLEIPKSAVITTVNGVPVTSAQELMQAVRGQIEVQRQAPRRLFLEYVHDGVDHAVEYRLM